MDLDLVLEWVPGTRNKLADILSRHSLVHDESTQTDGGGVSLQSLFVRTSVVEEVPDDLLEEARSHPDYSALRLALRESSPVPVEFELSQRHFSLEAGVLFYDHRICVSRGSGRRLAQEYHLSSVAVHPGIVKTVYALASRFYWPGLRKDVQVIVRECPRCQVIKSPTNPSPVPTYSDDAPPCKWHTIMMDFFTGLPPSSDGFDSILTVVDVLTRRTHFIPCQKIDTAEDTARRFFHVIFRLHGLPSKIISDRDTRWTSSFWSSIMNSLDVQLNLSTSFHPQTDALSENRHRTLALWMRAFSERQKSLWTESLPLLEFALNNSTNATISMSPFEADCGFQPRSPLGFSFENLANPSVHSFLQQSKELVVYLQASLQSLQENNTVPPAPFKPGDKVLVKIRDFFSKKGPYKNSLRTPWIGPFTILSKSGLTSFRLDLPKQWKLHDVFHAALLKPFLGKVDRIQPPPPAKLIGGQEEFVVEDILAERTTKTGTQFLTSWTRYPLSECTWQDFDSIKDTTAFKRYKAESSAFSFAPPSVFGEGAREKKLLTL